jgi:chemotaxis signal transduction protein
MINYCQILTLISLNKRLNLNDAAIYEINFKVIRKERNMKLGFILNNDSAP